MNQVEWLSESADCFLVSPSGEIAFAVQETYLGIFVLGWPVGFAASAVIV